MGRRTSLVRRPSGRSRFEGADQGDPLRRGRRVGADDARDRLLAAERDDRVLRRRADRRLPVRHQVDAAVRRRPAVLRRAAADLGHALPDRHRPDRGDPGRDPLGHVPVGVRAAPRAQGRQAGARAARRRADDRLRLLRAHVLHARGAAQRARPRRQPVQRALGRASSSASSSSRRSRRWSRTRCPRCRSRCARARPGSAPTASRPRSASSSPPRSRASSPRSCWARRARSARR